MRDNFYEKFIGSTTMGVDLFPNLVGLSLPLLIPSIPYFALLPSPKPVRDLERAASSLSGVRGAAQSPTHFVYFNPRKLWLNADSSIRMKTYDKNSQY